jgi:hypothetical protein
MRGDELPEGWWKSLPVDWWEQLARLDDVPVPIKPYSALEETIARAAEPLAKAMVAPPPWVSPHVFALWCFRPSDRKPSVKDLAALWTYANPLLREGADWLSPLLLYGCGVQRRTPLLADPAPDPWSGVWPSAIRQLEALAVDALRDGETTADDRAPALVKLLLKGGCRCVGWVGASASATQAVKCGRHHRADAWPVFDPTLSVGDLVARAIPGLEGDDER